MYVNAQVSIETINGVGVVSALLTNTSFSMYYYYYYIINC